MKNPLKNIKFNKPVQLLYGAIALLVLFFIVSRVVKMLKGLGDNTSPEAAEKEIDKNKLTFSKTEFKGFAETLEEAMDKEGTDEDAIYEVFRKLKTRSDVLALISAFGKRTSTAWTFDWLIYGQTTGTLSKWLQSDLSSSELKKINDILKTQGINYTF